MKMRMGRFPSVDATVSGSLLPKVLDYYYRKHEAILYIVGGSIKPSAPDPTNAIYISDLGDEQNNLSVLLVRGDPGRAIPGFVNPGTRTVLQSKPMDPGFVPGVSCHIAISKQEIATGDDRGQYRMVMEKSSGIGRALARSFFNTLLERYADEFPDLFIAERKRRNKKDKPETIRYRPTLVFHPQLNGSLERDLKEGRIGGFKLSRGSTEYKGEASEPVIQKLDVQLLVKIAPTNDFSKVRMLVDHVQLSLNMISFESLNIDLVDDSGNKIESTRQIDIDNLDEPDLRYCKMVNMPESIGIRDEVLDAFHEKSKLYLVSCLSDNSLW
jgi:hypothetical protein